LWSFIVVLLRDAFPTTIPTK